MRRRMRSGFTSLVDGIRRENPVLVGGGLGGIEYRFRRSVQGLRSTARVPEYP